MKPQQNQQYNQRNEICQPDIKCIFVDDQEHQIKKYLSFTSQNGDTYNGELINSQKHGFGVQKRQNDSYEGQWVKDLRQGKGKFVNKNGIVYEGVWFQDKPDGYGSITIPNDYFKNVRSSKQLSEEWLRICTNSLDDLFQKQGEIVSYRGIWKEGKMNSQGIAIFSNGDKYQGDFEEGQRNGQGEYEFQNGRKYVGFWLNDLFDGQGTFSHNNITLYQGANSLNQSFIHKLYKRKLFQLYICFSLIYFILFYFYTQMWKYGQLNGLGKEFYLDGSFFIGNFFQNIKEGAGKLYGKNKEIFESVWKQNVPDKICKITYEDNSVYEGEQKDFLKHGSGKIIYSNNEIYLGEFYDDQKNGKGIYRYYNGATYEGDWNQDKIEGKGVYIFENKEMYEGRWQGNKPNGRGKYKYDNGDEYQGFWQSGKQHGQGIYKYGNGSIYEGMWKEGNKHGYGILINQSKVLQGDWKNNQLVKGMLSDKITKETYNGQFIENSKRHGYGEQTYINGDKYHGYWDNDKKRGMGTFFFSNGDVFEGYWENDEKAGKEVYKYCQNIANSSCLKQQDDNVSGSALMIKEEQKQVKGSDQKIDYSSKQYDSQVETDYQSKKLSYLSREIEDVQHQKSNMIINSCDHLNSKLLSDSRDKNNAYKGFQKDIGIDDFIQLSEQLDRITLDLKIFQQYNSRQIYLNEENNYE